MKQIILGRQGYRTKSKCPKTKEEAKISRCKSCPYMIKRIPYNDINKVLCEFDEKSIKENKKIDGNILNLIEKKRVEVETIRNIRNMIRSEAKQAYKNSQISRRDWCDFGHYDDCGPSYEREYTDSKEKLKVLTELKIKFDKYYKKNREELREMEERQTSG